MIGSMSGVRARKETPLLQSATPIKTGVGELSEKVDSPVSKPVSLVEASPPPPQLQLVKTGVEPLVEPLVWVWRTEWKRHTENYRSISKRLWVREDGKWRPATRTDREQGLIAIEGPLNKRLKNFSANAEDKITKVGENEIKRTIEKFLNRRNIEGQRKLGQNLRSA